MKRPNRQTLAVAAVLAATAGAFPAIALAHGEKGPNGGAVIDVDERHLELVAAGQDITVFVSDLAYKPIATQGATGKAIMQAGGKTTTVTLVPGEANRLVGKAEAAVGKGAKVIVSTTLADGKSLQGRFVVP